MKLQKIAAGVRAFSLSPFLEKALGSRLDITGQKTISRDIFFVILSLC